jgi:xylulokinase
MNLLLGIDLGTSYFKVGLFDRDGGLHGLGRVRVEKQSPAPGRQELPIEEFWRSLREALAAALTEAGASAADIVAVSYASQANSFVLLDRNDAPLTPIVLWTDCRAEPVDDGALAWSRTEAFARTTGFSGFAVESAVNKWRWFQQNQPEVWARTRRALTISDYLAFTLTGEFVGDASTAAFTGLYNVRSHGWWHEGCEHVGVDVRQLATPVCSGCRAGRTGAGAAARLGLLRGIPFAVGALDHHAAAIGAGLGQVAEVSISTGTVLAALMLVNDPIPAAECYHAPHLDGGRYIRLAFDAAGAGQLERYRDAQAPEHSVAELIRMAVAPDLIGGADQRHARDVRVLLDQMVATHRRLIERIWAGRNIRGLVATGGATRSADWLQYVATALGVPIRVTGCAERACLGAALFAAVAAGWYRDVGEASRAMARTERMFEPRPVLAGKLPTLTP